MNALSAELYVSPGTKRDCATAAQLLGLASADAYAEMTLRAALDAVPEVAALSRAIGSAVRKAREEWAAKHPLSPTPEAQARHQIAEARQ